MMRTTYPLLERTVSVTAGPHSLQRAQRLWAVLALAILTLPIEIVARHWRAWRAPVISNKLICTVRLRVPGAAVRPQRTRPAPAQQRDCKRYPVVTLAGALTIQAHMVNPEAVVHIWLLALGAIGLLQFAYAALHNNGMRAAWQREMPAALIVVLGVALAPFCLWLSNRIYPVRGSLHPGVRRHVGHQAIGPGRSIVHGISSFWASHARFVISRCHLESLFSKRCNLRNEPKRKSSWRSSQLLRLAIASTSCFRLRPVYRLRQRLSRSPTSNGDRPPVPRDRRPVECSQEWAAIVACGLGDVDLDECQDSRSDVAAAPPYFRGRQSACTMGVPDTHWLTDIVVSISVYDWRPGSCATFAFPLTAERAGESFSVAELSSAPGW